MKELVIQNPIDFLNKEIKKNKMIYNNVEDIIIHMFFVTSSGFKYKEINSVSEIVVKVNSKEEKEMSSRNKIFNLEIKEKLESQKEQLKQLKEISLDDNKVSELIKDNVIPSKQVLDFLIKTIEKSNNGIEKIIEENKNKNNYKNLKNVEDYKNLEFNEDYSEYSIISQLGNGVVSVNSLISDVPDNLNPIIKEILDNVIIKLFNSKTKRNDMLEMSKTVKYLKKFIN